MLGISKLDNNFCNQHVQFARNPKRVSTEPVNEKRKEKKENKADFPKQSFVCFCRVLL